MVESVLVPSGASSKGGKVFSAAVLGAGLLLSLAGSGCGSGVAGLAAGSQALMKVAGGVHGGQQPVSGAKVYLYAAAMAGGGTATSLLNGPGYVTTDAQGGFSISGDYTCPAGAYVYALAKGGNPGLAAGTDNPALALAAGLGPCSSLSSAQFVTINEVTTVAMAYSVAGLATTETQIGSGSQTALASAFANVTNLVNAASGLANTVTPTGGGLVPQSKINSLADSLGACVNSDGTGVACQDLMSAANVATAGSLPVDTFQAALNIAKSPTVNTSTIFNLSNAAAPFRPALSSAPGDWTLAIVYPGMPGYPGQVSVSLSPGSSVITQTAQQTLSVGVANATAGSYLWAVSGSVGTLTELGGTGRKGQTSFCSTSPVARYVPNGAPTLTANSSDQVSVQAFPGANCTAGNSLGGASTGITVAVPTRVAGYSTVTRTMSVVLPAGSKVSADQLLVVSSAGTATPLSSGTFLLPVFNAGEQIALVLSPRGTTMMMGWADASHTTISAETTAEVFAYYALGGWLMLQQSDRDAVIAQIPGLPGTAALTQVVAQEIAANPDALAQSDAPISNALDALFTSVSGGIVPYARGGKDAVKPHDVIGDPGASAEQSGVSLISQNPFAAYMMNAYRRRTHAFVIHVQDTVKGQTPVQVNRPVTDFDLAPASGLSGGVTGAFSDLFQSYFGNQPSAYAPVSTDPFNLPLTPGFDSSTYQIINLGPGRPGGADVQLTSAQQTQLLQTSISDFVLDALFPFVTNVVIGSGFFGDGNANLATGAADARNRFLLRLETDLLTFVGNVSGEQDVIKQNILAGNFKSSLSDLAFGSASAELQAILLDAMQAIGGEGTDVEAKSPLTLAAKNFTAALGAAGGVLQIFDSSVLKTQLEASHEVDAWTVTAFPTKAVLQPLNPTINGYNFVSLTATVPSADDTSGYSYQWSIAPASGQGLIGNLTPNDGSGRQGLTTTFCSSSSSVNYDNTLSAVQNLSNTSTTGADTVTVTVFGAASCAAASQLTKPVSSIVTTAPNAGVTLLPYSPFLNAGGSVALTAVYSDKSVTPGSYQWTFTAGNNGAAAGTLNSADGAGSNTFCSASPNATYVSTAAKAPATNLMDGVAVTAYNGPGCASGGSAQLGVSGSTTVTTTAAPLLIVAPSVTINPGQQVQIGAAFSAYVTGAPAIGSFLWSNTGTYGTLQGGNSFCTASSSVTYLATPNSALSQSVSDLVTALAFSDKNCTQQVGIGGHATVNIEPPAGPFVATAGAFSSVLQSGDGNFYATASGSCGPTNQDSCDYISRVDPEGTVTVLHTFYVNQNTSYCQKSVTGVCTNDEGSLLNPLLEAADGNLYGTARAGGSSANGTVFRMTKDGTLTVLYDFPNGVLPPGLDVPDVARPPVSVQAKLAPDLACPCGGCQGGNGGGSYVPPPNYVPFTGYAPGRLIEGSDGYLYGTALGGVAYGHKASGVFFRISPSGNFELRRILTYQTYVVSGSAPTRCGGTILSYSPVYLDPVYFSSGGGAGIPAPSLVQALDGSFYGQMEALDQSNANYPYGYYNGRIFRLDAGGNASAVYDYGLNSPLGNPLTTAPLIGGPGGLLFGAASNGIFSATTGGSVQMIQTSQGGATAPLSLLGSDGNFYGIDSSLAAFLQTTQQGAQSSLGAITDSSSSANIRNGYGCQTCTMIETSNGNLVGPAVAYNSVGAFTSYVYNDQVSNTLKGPIQLAFATPVASVNRPITLTWKVLNAFSLTAQVCHATVLDNATGAGDWSGAQAGSLQGNVYTGTATLVPSARGTYTYGLTCGGTESGFTTLTVQ